MALLGATALALVSFPRLEPRAQLLLAAGQAVALVAAALWPGRVGRFALVALSLAATARYTVWRATATLDFPSTLETVLGAGLFAAELYAAAMLLSGYTQTMWPRHRRPLPMPPDPEAWPSVDVYIPTLDEPLALVRSTVLAALAMDWPPDRLQVWLLDDDGREEFRAFAESAGCRYLARQDRRHAKAGNLNFALGQSHGAVVAVFDCDHAPTRAFLQLSVGWLLADPSLAVVQTAQHFRAPDVFQRNLAGGSLVPAEPTLFHGLVQDGRDGWNAAMFSGSGAVLRRAALDDVGGFSTRSVTEDAHTALRLHRRGWGSAYLRLPLSAGLPPDSLAQHIAQRRRWTRGMLQILRRDNPLFGPGLTFAQRLSHLHGAAHFLFALPRIAFLTAPLAYLLGGVSVISAPALALIAYALPHFALAVAATSRLQGGFRHSFWSEVFETVLAAKLVGTTLSTLLIPRGGRFLVTRKGDGPASGFFDARAAAPNVVLAALLLAGIACGAAELLSGSASGALLMNLGWAAVALLILLASVAVAREAPAGEALRPLRHGFPVAVLLADGRTLAAEARAVSLQRASIAVRRPPDLAADVVTGGAPESAPEFAGPMSVALAPPGTPPGERLPVAVECLRWEADALLVRWMPASLEQEACVVRAVFGAADTWIADAWTTRADAPRDRPWIGFAHLLRSASGLVRGRRPSVTWIAAAGGMLCIALTSPPLAAAQTPRKDYPRAIPRAQEYTVRPIPGVIGQPSPAPRAEPVPAFPPASTVLAPIATPEKPPTGARRIVYTLAQLGAAGPLSLRGTNPAQAITFGVRPDEVVLAAQLDLSGAMSPALLPDLSHVMVTLNDHPLGGPAAARDRPAFGTALELPPASFQALNRLEFRFAGRYAGECNDPLSDLLWATVSDTSTLTLTLQRLAPERDLARLPLPFVAARERDALSLPFVVPAAGSDDTMRAAAIVASWLGARAGPRGGDFPVLAEPPAEGNAVVVAVGGEGAGIPGLPAIAGPTLAVLPNPRDPLGSLLLVGGRTGAEAVAAATMLGVGGVALSGERATVQAPDLLARAAYDAPNWVSRDRPVRLGDLVDASALQVSGYVGQLRVPFAAAPDLHLAAGATFPLDLRYRAPPAPIVDLGPSRLDVGIGARYLASLSLAPLAADPSWLGGLLGRGPDADGPSRARVAIPADAVGGGNDLRFYFDARPLHRGDCSGIPADLHMAIDADSTIDLSGADRFATLPNLAWFVGSGFPFTKFADLSTTAAILPDRPSAAEISGFLGLMGRLGGITGLPAFRVAVARPGEAASVAERDLLLVGAVARLQGADSLLSASPVRLSGSRLQLAVDDTGGSWRRVFGGGAASAAVRSGAAAALSADVPEAMAVLVGARSPLREGRSLVAVLGGGPAAVADAVAGLRDPDRAAAIGGDLAIVSAGRATAWRVGPTYAVGYLPFWKWPGRWLDGQPLGLLALSLVGCGFLVAAFARMFRHRPADRTEA